MLLLSFWDSGRRRGDTLSDRHMMITDTRQCAALAWAEYLDNLVQVKTAELCQQHQQHQQRQ